MLAGKTVTTSFLQRLPFARRKYAAYLPLMPLAIEQFNLSRYDLVISSSHCVAKGVLTGPDQLHISYVHTPMRYAWDAQHEYLAGTRLGPRAQGLAGPLDAAQAAACGTCARRRGRRFVRGQFAVHRPADLEDLSPRAPASSIRRSIPRPSRWASRREDFYLTASRLVPYKQVDVLVEAFAQMPDKRLVVIGDGPELEQAAGHGHAERARCWAIRMPAALRDYHAAGPGLSVRRARGFWHRAGRGPGGRHAGHRLRPGRGAGNDPRARRGASRPACCSTSKRPTSVIEAVGTFERHERPHRCRPTAGRTRCGSASSDFIASSYEHAMARVGRRSAARPASGRAADTDDDRRRSRSCPSTTRSSRLNRPRVASRRWAAGAVARLHQRVRPGVRSRIASISSIRHCQVKLPGKSQACTPDRGRWPRQHAVDRGR